MAYEACHFYRALRWSVCPVSSFPSFPPTPFLLEFPFPLFHVTAGVILGLAMQECPACAQRQDCSVLAKATASAQTWGRPGQLILVFAASSLKVLGGRVPFIDKMGTPEKRQMQEGGHGEREGGLRNAILTARRICWGGCSLLLLRAVTSKWLSGCSGIPCPAHHAFHLYSHVRHSRLHHLKLFTSPHCGAWKDGELPCLRNEVGYLQAEPS